MNIIEYIKYFAKFPADIDYVTRYFKNSNSTLNTELKQVYDELYTDLMDLPVQELIPEIKGFYFGNNADELITAIKNIGQPFLYVMYPEYISRGNNEFNNTTSLQVIFSVLHEYSDRNRDQFERLVIEKHCEDIRLKVIDFIREQQFEGCNLRPRIDWANVQKVYEQSFGCIGWTTVMTWEIDGII